MKKIMLALVLVFVFASVSTADKPIKNSPDGFRGIKWGSPISALGKTAKMVEEDKNDETKFYQKTNEDLTLGGATLSRVAYSFWRGKFAGVIIKCDSSAEFEALKSVAIERFGTPVKPNRYIETYGWIDGNAFISLTKNPTRLMIVSMRLFNEQQEARAKKAKAGAATGF